MSKPLKGVITTWTIVNGHVVGKCLFHTDDDRESSIRTSEIVQISAPRGGDVRLCETSNSRYILIGDPS